MENIFSPESFVKPTVDANAHKKWITTVRKKKSHYLSKTESYLRYLLGDETVEFNDDIPPIFHDASRFVYAMLNVLPAEISPVSAYLRNYQGDICNNSGVSAQLFYETVIRTDYLLTRVFNLFIHDYFYFLKDFLDAPRIQYADMMQLGNDVDTQKCKVYGWAPATIRFSNDIEVSFPFLPCTFHVGVVTYRDTPLTDADTTHFDEGGTHFVEITHGPVDGTAVVMMPTLLCPGFNFPLITHMQSVVSEIYKIDTPDVVPKISAKPTLYTKQQFQTLLSNNELPMWEHVGRKPDRCPQDPLLSVPFDKLRVQ